MWESVYVPITRAWTVNTHTFLLLGKVNNIFITRARFCYTDTFLLGKVNNIFITRATYTATTILQCKVNTIFITRAMVCNIDTITAFALSKRKIDSLLYLLVNK